MQTTNNIIKDDTETTQQSHCKIMSSTRKVKKSAEQVSILPRLLQATLPYNNPSMLFILRLLFSGQRASPNTGNDGYHRCQELGAKMPVLTSCGSVMKLLWPRLIAMK